MIFLVYFQASEVFMNQPFETENIVSFLEMTLHSQMSPKMSEEERQQNYDSPAPPERHDDAPYIDHDACKNYKFMLM